MFENLSDNLESVFKKLKGQGKLTEKNIEEGLREVRIALLEADVHFRVVKRFIADIRAQALGQEVMTSLTPGQQVVKIVNEQLTELMGAKHEALNLSGPRPVALMLTGLQGSGIVVRINAYLLQFPPSHPPPSEGGFVNGHKDFPFQVTEGLNVVTVCLAEDHTAKLGIPTGKATVLQCGDTVRSIQQLQFHVE